jgi:type II secretory pathway component PulK
MLSAGRRYRGHEQGLALVMTLFVVALVTILVLEYHFDAAVEIDLATNYAGDVQAYHLAMAGVRFAQALLQRDGSNSDGPDDSWYKLGLIPACFSPQQLIELATTGGGEELPTAGPDAKASADRRVEQVSQGDVGCVSLRITDENSKLPINALMPPKGDENQPAPAVWVGIFQAFFESFKIDPEVVDALIDWIDEGENPRGTSGAEKSYYTSLPVPYEPPNKRMRTPGELRLVKGLDNLETLAKLFPGATPEAVADLDLGSNNYLTPFGAEQAQPGTPPNPPPRQPPPQLAPQPARVNVNTASAEVLKALITGVQPGRSNADAEVQEIVAKRQDKQFKTLNDMPLQDGNLRTALRKVADVKSTYFRVESVGVVGIVQKKIVAVLKRASQQPIQPNQLTQSNQSSILYFKVE